MRTSDRRMRRAEIDAEFKRITRCLPDVREAMDDALREWRRVQLAGERTS